MKSRGMRNPPTSHPALSMRSLILFAAALFVVLLRFVDALDPTATSWIVNVPAEPTTVGQLSSSVTIGRYTYLFGGLPTTQPFVNTTLQQYLTSVAGTATAVNYVDTVQSHAGTPVTLDPVLHPPPWVNISSNITNNASSWKEAALPIPTVGENNAVVVGSTVFALAMCNVLPAGVIVDYTSDADLDHFRSGWVMMVVSDATGNPSNMTPSGNHTNVPNLTATASGHRLADPFNGAPRVQLVSFSLDKSLSPRINASCVAHGTDIYIVGGLQLSSTGQQPTLTNSVAMFDTIHRRFTDSAWVHDEAVANPGVTSDDSFIYIVGGQLSTDVLSLGVFAHHVPSNVKVSESGYPQPQYLFPFVAVLNGVIVVSGSPYGTIATWSMRQKNGFPVANPNSAPSIVGGTLTAMTTSQNITLALFGGITPNAGTNTAFYESTLTVGNSLWNPESSAAPLSFNVFGIRYYENATTTVSPSWLPNNDGNITARVEGYTVVWTNFTFSILFENASLASICNISAGANLATMDYCTIRVSTSPRCDDSYVSDVVVGPHTTRMVTLENKRRVLAVGPFSPITSLPTPPITPPTPGSDSDSSSSGATPPPIAGPEDFYSVGGSDGAPTTTHTYTAPMYATVCLSTTPYAVPGCVGSTDFTSTNCLAYFFTPLTASEQTGPFMVYSSAGMGPHAPTSAPTPARGNPSSTTKLALYIGVGGGIMLLLCVIGIVVWRRNKTEEGWNDYDDDDGPDETSASFLSRNGGEKRRRSSSNQRASPKKNDANSNQQQGLLDGKYRFVQRLGKGSFSVVYLVERVADAQRFALKYVQIADDTDRHEAMKECEVVHRLQGHPNVIHLYDMFMSYRFDTNLLPDGSNSPSGPSINGSNKSPKYFDATNFGVRVDDDGQRGGGGGSNRQVSGERFLSLVMEYHERGDLGKWAKKQKGDPRVPEATVLSIAFQTLSVLHYMHGSSPPIIHRDLKPENILLSSVVYENMSGTFLPIVVTDFGLSRVMDKTFCETGVGSLPYVAPECWQRCYSTKVDIWALGCILYAVCAKRVEPDNVKVMFSESTRPDFYKKLFHELNTVYGYSEGCAKFIITLLDVDPNHRPAAADALKRLKRRRAASASSPLGPSGLRKESELDHSEASLKSYGSEEMGKDAQCEFYIPMDTSFGILSNGWNLNAPTTYGTNDLPLGMVTSGPLPQMPIRLPSVPPQGTTTSSTRTNSSGSLQQPLPAPAPTPASAHSSTTSSSNHTGGSGSKGAVAPRKAAAVISDDDASVCSMKLLAQAGAPPGEDQ